VERRGVEWRGREQSGVKDADGGSFGLFEVAKFREVN
jgi:hypothetical protein